MMGSKLIPMGFSKGFLTLSNNLAMASRQAIKLMGDCVCPATG
jgi:hypothetical protein